MEYGDDVSLSRYTRPAKNYQRATMDAPMRIYADGGAEVKSLPSVKSTSNNSSVGPTNTIFSQPLPSSTAFPSSSSQPTTLAPSASTIASSFRRGVSRARSTEPMFARNSTSSQTTSSPPVASTVKPSSSSLTSDLSSASTTSVPPESTSLYRVNLDLNVIAREDRMYQSYSRETTFFQRFKTGAFTFFSSTSVFFSCVFIARVVALLCGYGSYLNSPPTTTFIGTIFAPFRSILGETFSFFSLACAGLFVSSITILSLLFSFAVVSPRGPLPLFHAITSAFTTRNPVSILLFLTAPLAIFTAGWALAAAMGLPVSAPASVASRFVVNGRLYYSSCLPVSESGDVLVSVPPLALPLPTSLLSGISSTATTQGSLSSLSSAAVSSISSAVPVTADATSFFLLFGLCLLGLLLVLQHFAFGNNVVSYSALRRGTGSGHRNHPGSPSRTNSNTSSIFPSWFSFGTPVNEISGSPDAELAYEAYDSIFFPLLQAFYRPRSFLFPLFICSGLFVILYVITMLIDPLAIFLPPLASIASHVFLPPMLDPSFLSISTLVGKTFFSSSTTTSMSDSIPMLDTMSYVGSPPATIAPRLSLLALTPFFSAQAMIPHSVLAATPADADWFTCYIPSTHVSVARLASGSHGSHVNHSEGTLGALFLLPAGSPSAALSFQAVLGVLLVGTLLVLLWNRAVVYANYISSEPIPLREFLLKALTDDSSSFFSALAVREVAQSLEDTVGMKKNLAAASVAEPVGAGDFAVLAEQASPYGSLLSPSSACYVGSKMTKYYLFGPLGNFFSGRKLRTRGGLMNEGMDMMTGTTPSLKAHGRFRRLFGPCTQFCVEFDRTLSKAAERAIKSGISSLAFATANGLVTNLGKSSLNLPLGREQEDNVDVAVYSRTYLSLPAWRVVQDALQDRFVDNLTRRIYSYLHAAHARSLSLAAAKATKTSAELKKQKEKEAELNQKKSQNGSLSHLNMKAKPTSFFGVLSTAVSIFCSRPFIVRSRQIMCNVLTTVGDFIGVSTLMNKARWTWTVTTQQQSQIVFLDHQVVCEAVLALAALAEASKDLYPIDLGSAQNATVTPGASECIGQVLSSLAQLSRAIEDYIDYEIADVTGIVRTSHTLSPHAQVLRGPLLEVSTAVNDAVYRVLSIANDSLEKYVFAPSVAETLEKYMNYSK